MKMPGHILAESGVLGFKNDVHPTFALAVVIGWHGRISALANVARTWGILARGVDLDGEREQRRIGKKRNDSQNRVPC